MRSKYYLTFHQTLSKFVTDENFTIEFKLFTDKYILGYDLKMNMFTINGSYASKSNLDSVYKIIKCYVIDELGRQQKHTFCNELEKVKSVNMNDVQKEAYYNLRKLFKPLLWQEPISVYDIERKGCIHKLRYGFRGTEVIESFLVTILETLQNNPTAFDSAIIDWWMWPSSYTVERMRANLEIFEKEEYVIIDKKEFLNDRFIVKLTGKYYEAFKKSFYYTYDSDITQPYVGCIHAR